MADIISIDDFKKLEIRVGEIRSVEKVADADKLLKLVVNFGDHDRQVLSAIAEYLPDPQTLVGKRYPFVTNLAPRTIRGLESQAMILAAGGGEEPLYLFESNAPAGTVAK